MKTKLVQTEDYLLLLSVEASISKGDMCLAYLSVMCNNNRNSFTTTSWQEIVQYPIKSKSSFKYDTIVLRKILAYYPLREGVKELELPVLPNPFKEKFDVHKFIQEEFQFTDELMVEWEKELSDSNLANYGNILNLVEKIQKSKQFSLEDIKKAFNAGYDLNTWEQLEIPNVERDYSHEDEYIQSLSTKQYPKEFIMEEVETNSPIPQFKTIRNIEGKFVIQGTYKW